jgi:excisionase family DNA binding protein
MFWSNFCLAAEEELLMEEKPGDVLTIEELATYLKIPKSTLYKLVREGKVPSQKVGRHWRFHKEAIVQWLGNREADDANRKPMLRKGEI